MCVAVWRTDRKREEGLLQRECVMPFCHGRSGRQGEKVVKEELGKLIATACCGSKQVGAGGSPDT